MSTFATFPEQEEAKRLLTRALEAPAHAYLFFGPPGVGKRTAAIAFAGELLGDHTRVEHEAHPDLYILEPLGDQIRIDPIRDLRRDLHMRPFEGDRRVYLILGADFLNQDAADALLKDLEEPPEYAIIVLTADDLGPVPETIRSRCQHIPFRRLSHQAIRRLLEDEGVDGQELEALTRVAAGRLDRARRLVDPEAGQRRNELIQLARSVYIEPEFDSGAAERVVMALARERGEQARARIEASVPEEEHDRQLEQRATRARRGAEREEILDTLDLLSGWYRDLVVAAAGATGAVHNSDFLETLLADANDARALAAEEATEVLRETWRTFEEFNVQPSLALEALFVRLRHVLHGSLRPAGMM